MMPDNGNGSSFDAAKLHTFPGISAEAFQYPDDRKATSAIQQLPIFPQILKTISGGVLEKATRLDQISNSFRLGPNQGRAIYRLFVRAAEILSLDELPEIFLASGAVNAYASGMKKHTVTLLSPLVSMLKEEELLAVIGHELGHIKCGHMANKTLASYLAGFGAEGIGAYIPVLGPLAMQGLMVPLAHWSRMAEISCDRAGLLVVQDPKIVASALAKIGGWSEMPLGEISFEALEEQLREYDQADDTVFDSILKIKQSFDSLYSSHPLTALRIKKILQWGESDHYRSILSGDYPRAEVRADGAGKAHCTACGQLLAAGSEFCPTCGARQSVSAAGPHCPNKACGCPVKPGQKFCTKCGTDLSKLPPPAESSPAVPLA